MIRGEMIRDKIIFETNLPSIATTSLKRPFQSGISSCFSRIATKCMCRSLGVQTITVEIDSQLAIQAIHEGEASFTQHATIIREIIELSKRFQECKFQYANRLGNQVANTLARHAWRVNEFSV